MLHFKIPFMRRRASSSSLTPPVCCMPASGASSGVSRRAASLLRGVVRITAKDCYVVFCDFRLVVVWASLLRLRRSRGLGSARQRRNNGRVEPCIEARGGQRKRRRRRRLRSGLSRLRQLSGGLLHGCFPAASNNDAKESGGSGILRSHTLSVPPRRKRPIKLVALSAPSPQMLLHGCRRPRRAPSKHRRRALDVTEHHRVSVEVGHEQRALKEARNGHLRAWTRRAGKTHLSAPVNGPLREQRGATSRQRPHLWCRPS